MLIRTHFNNEYESFRASREIARGRHEQEMGIDNNIKLNKHSHFCSNKKIYMSKYICKNVYKIFIFLCLFPSAIRTR